MVERSMVRKFSSHYNNENIVGVLGRQNVYLRISRNARSCNICASSFKLRMSTNNHVRIRLLLIAKCTSSHINYGLKPKHCSTSKLAAQFQKGPLELGDKHQNKTNENQVPQQKVVFAVSVVQAPAWR